MVAWIRLYHGTLNLTLYLHLLVWARGVRSADGLGHRTGRIRVGIWARDMPFEGVLVSILVLLSPLYSLPLLRLRKILFKKHSLHRSRKLAKQ